MECESLSVQLFNLILDYKHHISLQSSGYKGLLTSGAGWLN